METKKIITWIIVITLFVSIIGSGVMILIETSSPIQTENPSLISGEDVN
ncbi:hypothetical protein KBD33_04385 [Candidatus Gracilibacteria bacterium]|nr:hypothetical protein [Candidatus Gracilibacteria bacterium]